MSILHDIGVILLIVGATAAIVLPIVIAVRKIKRERDARKRFMKHLEPWRNDG